MCEHEFLQYSHICNQYSVTSCCNFSTAAVRHRFVPDDASACLQGSEYEDDISRGAVCRSRRTFLSKSVKSQCRNLWGRFEMISNHQGFDRFPLLLDCRSGSLLNTQGLGAQLEAAPNPRRACARHGSPSVTCDTPVPRKMKRTVRPRQKAKRRKTTRR